MRVKLRLAQICLFLIFVLIAMFISLDLLAQNEAPVCNGRSVFMTVQHENGHTVKMWRTANLVGFKSNMDVNRL